MMDKNSEMSVTSVTGPSLLQRMNQRRCGIPNKIEESSIASPLIIPEEFVKSPFPQLVINWLSICLEEGHIQPSQPSVGRLEGWPMRPYFKKSLHVDFECWCSRKDIPVYLVPQEDLFYQVTDLIFESIEGSRYNFPDLMTCRERFSQLIKEGFYDQS